MNLSPRSLAAKLRSFARAVWSMRRGDTTLAAYEGRQRVCLTCPQLDRTRRGLFCKACGCPQYPLSDLRTKWRIRGISCPLQYW